MKSINNLLKITKEAYDFVKGACEVGSMEIIVDDGDQSIVRAWNDECEILYGYAQHEDSKYITTLLQAIRSRKHHTEYCVNLYGENHEAIKTIQALGFSLDQHGYQLQHNQLMLLPNMEGLIIEDYSPRYIEQVATLYDEAYHTTVFQQMGVSFNQDMIKKAKSNQAKIAFRNNELVGSYMLDGPYIAELVVSPKHQGRGIGTQLVADALNVVLSNHQECLLRVQRNNHRALKVYQKLGFQTIGSYAEHTLL